MRVSRLARAVVEAAVVAAFAAMVAATILQVVSRYVFGSPLGWTEEVAKISMVWWTFVVVGLLAWRGRLLGIDAALLAMPARGAHLTAAVAQAVAAVVAAWLAVLGVRLVGLAGTQISPALDIPYAWIYLALPVGLGVAAAGFAARAILHAQAARAANPPHPIGAQDRSDA